MRPRSATPAGIPGLSPFAASRQGVTHGNQTRLLVGGEAAYPAMLEAIAGAQGEILLESYTIAGDGTGRAFFDALEAAARRGVEVRLLCDGMGSFGLPSAWFAALEAAGGRAVVYRPVAPWRARWGLLRRDHRKVLVVDRRIGFLGGLNLADEYDGYARAGEFWRDLHMAVDGPAAWSLAGLFAGTWNRCTDRDRRMPWQPPVAALFDGDAGVAVQVIGNHETSHRSLIRRSFFAAIHRARRTIRIANPYFIPDHSIAGALGAAVERGVDVRVLVPARSDILLVDLASRAAFPRLLRRGVRIAEWSFGMMHAKAASVDGEWATVGSYNLDHRSWRYNLEVTANVFDPVFA